MPTLDIGGESFACRPNLPQWRLMELAAAARSNDPMAQMAGMHAFVLAVINPEERDRFVEAMHALDDDVEAPDTLDTAIGNLMEQYATPPGGVASPRPTKRSSSSAAGPTSTGGTSRVVSLSRGTVKSEDSSTAGRSAAS